jgi:hypothetical protein
MRAPRPARPAPRRRLVGLVAGLLALLATAALANDYFPAAAGMSWTYDSGTTQVMSGPREIDGVSVMVLTHYLGGIPISEDYLAYGADGVFTVATAAGGQVLRYEPPLLVYAAAPLQPGTTWSSATRVGGIEISLSAEVVGLRGMKTPAGRFNALQIRQRTLTSTGGQTLMDLFLVPGVGVVRFVTEDGTVIDLIERAF